MKTALELIAEERARQIAEGFDAAHDDQHKDGALIEAAQCYACVASAQVRGSNVDEWPVEMFNGFNDSLLQWPWEDDDYSPDGFALNNAVKAAALLVAEVERLQRLVRRPIAS